MHLLTVEGLHIMFNAVSWLFLVLLITDYSIRGFLKVRLSDRARMSELSGGDSPTLFPWHPAGYFRSYGFFYNSRTDLIADRSIRTSIWTMRIIIPLEFFSLVFLFY